MDLSIVSFLAILHNPDTYGHIFYATILTGTFFVTRKKKIGWIFRVIGDIGWVAIGCNIKLDSIVFLRLIFYLKVIRGFLMWQWTVDIKKLKKQRKLNENK